MSLALQLQALATRIAHHVRDAIAPRLIPLGGGPGQYLSPKADGKSWEWLPLPGYSGDPGDAGYADALQAVNTASAVLAGYLDAVGTVPFPTGTPTSDLDADIENASTAVLAAAAALTAYTNSIGVINV